MEDSKPLIASRPDSSVLPSVSGRWLPSLLKVTSGDAIATPPHAYNSSTAVPGSRNASFPPHHHSHSSSALPLPLEQEQSTQQQQQHLSKKALKRKRAEARVNKEYAASCRRKIMGEFRAAGFELPDLDEFEKEKAKAEANARRTPEQKMRLVELQSELEEVTEKKRWVVGEIERMEKELEERKAEKDLEKMKAERRELAYRKNGIWAERRRIWSFDRPGTFEDASSYPFHRDDE
ncbi:hypothetical protein K402DRAFT_419238 [Aulographum hederae CBS 113979]|uniref:Uncharacterized protein n=1 Tax=Aulographum hederae CBS 113979 TaxID=1176131 RepID=A0A6G1H764_9PEZI|nr:hypothetical protein K402DRAFT_419238 [Aulographum hederae CBS 113979]